MQSLSQQRVSGQREQPLAKCREYNGYDDQGCSDKRITIRRFIKEDHLPDEREEDVRTPSESHRTRLFDLQRQGEQDLAQETENRQSDDEETICATSGQTECAENEVTDQERVDEGERAKVRHDYREVESLQGAEKNVSVLEERRIIRYNKLVIIPISLTAPNKVEEIAATGPQILSNFVAVR